MFKLMGRFGVEWSLLAEMSQALIWCWEIMVPPTKLQTYLDEIQSLSAKIYVEGDRTHAQTLNDLIDALDAADRRSRPNPGKTRNSFLYVALAASLALFASVRRKNGRIEKYLHQAAIRKPRNDGNPAVQFVRLVLSDCSRQSYSRYGRAVLLASERKLSPAEFEVSLHENRGVVKFIENFGE